jgi:hypothetical protein
VILAELQRLEAKGARKFEEDKRRRDQRMRAATEMADRNQRLAASGFGELVSVDTMMGAMDGLEKGGTFFDEVEAEVREEFLPWLTEEIGAALEIKEVLDALKRTAARRAIAVRKERTEIFQTEIHEPRKEAKTRKELALRRVFIEDQGAEAIRRRYREQREKKEREAAEEAARLARAEAESESEAAAKADPGGESERDGDDDSGISDSN